MIGGGRPLLFLLLATLRFFVGIGSRFSGCADEASEVWDPKSSRSIVFALVVSPFLFLWIVFVLVFIMIGVSVGFAIRFCVEGGAALTGSMVDPMSAPSHFWLSLPLAMLVPVSITLCSLMVCTFTAREFRAVRYKLTQPER